MKKKRWLEKIQFLATQMLAAAQLSLRPQRREALLARQARPAAALAEAQEAGPEVAQVEVREAAADSYPT